MKRLLISAAALAASIAVPAASYANINHFDGFQGGGIEVWDTSGNYCIMATSDVPSTAGASALTGGANRTPDTILNASQVGWGYGVYGGYTCTNIHIYF